jgi:hypothetical protein
MGLAPSLTGETWGLPQDKDVATMSGGMHGGGIREPAQNSMNGLGSSIGVEGEFTIDRRD